jgi:hypothetical protein
MADLKQYIAICENIEYEKKILLHHIDEQIRNKCLSLSKELEIIKEENKEIVET